MKKLALIALLFSGQAFSKEVYVARCIADTETRTHPLAMDLFIRQNNVNLSIQGQWVWCVFVDREDDFSIYDCDEYTTRFTDSMRKMIYGSQSYTCIFEGSDGYQTKHAE